MQLRNVTPLGIELDVPLLRTSVKYQEVVDVSEDHARRLLETTNWEAADAEAESVARQLQAEAQADADTPDEEVNA